MTRLQGHMFIFEPLHNNYNLNAYPMLFCWTAQSKRSEMIAIVYRIATENNWSSLSIIVTTSSLTCVGEILILYFPKVLLWLSTRFKGTNPNEIHHYVYFLIKLVNEDVSGAVSKCYQVLNIYMCNTVLGIHQWLCLTHSECSSLQRIGYFTRLAFGRNSPDQTKKTCMFF